MEEKQHLTNGRKDSIYLMEEKIKKWKTAFN